jgi:hypothetical protein
MGERLVVQIQRNDKLIATSYYHWSAYTEPALRIVKSMYDRVLRQAGSMSDEQLQLAIIRFAECSTYLGYFETATERDEAINQCRMDNKNKPKAVQQLMESLIYSHGGLDPCDMEMASKLFPNERFESDGVSRNEGLVAISNESMQSQCDWAQSIVTINLDKGVVFNGAIYEYDKQSYMSEVEDYDDEYYIAPDMLPKIPIDLAEFNLDEIDLVIEMIEITSCDWVKYEEKIYQLISG